MPVFWCRTCGKAKKFEASITWQEACSFCASTTWTSEFVPPQITKQDQRFLKTILIVWE